MDMTRHPLRYLDLATLRSMGGRYIGIVQAVVEEDLRNRFRRGAAHKEPVIVFEDQWRLGPSIGMRQDLIAMLGSETDDWIGACLVSFLQRMSDRTTGRPTDRWEKCVALGPGATRRPAP